MKNKKESIKAILCEHIDKLTDKDIVIESPLTINGIMNIHIIAIGNNFRIEFKGEYKIYQNH